ncbi:NAD(P)/FAD-dependent oxidoreductase [Rhizobium sp. YIM 134829]|uniref:NAD(P)/FAD-dependent oxidoreductase n=1 Tax=Rhizobium sp. YIM 134829 TaxID=3390453 RepID=UPI00397C533A
MFSPGSVSDVNRHDGVVMRLFMTSRKGENEADCVVIGGGPAGLTAALYLARFHISVTVLHDGSSRAHSIPLSHNQSLFPGGISGADLLRRMQEQALAYGADLRLGSILDLTQADGGFTVHAAHGSVRAKTVLLATGVINHRPKMDEQEHDDAIKRGLLRYCPICDAFEVTDKAVAVLGSGQKGHAEAVFLRSYSRDITLITPEAEHGLTSEQVARLQALGIRIEAGPLDAIELDGNRIGLKTRKGLHWFDTLYPALGSNIRSGLAGALGARLSEEGCVIVDRHQRTSVAGLYAAGDVVAGLDQISNAMGQATLAATAIRNDLSERATLRR